MKVLSVLLLFLSFANGYAREVSNLSDKLAGLNSPSRYATLINLLTKIPVDQIKSRNPIVIEIHKQLAQAIIDTDKDYLSLQKGEKMPIIVKTAIGFGTTAGALPGMVTAGAFGALVVGEVGSAGGYLTVGLIVGGAGLSAAAGAAITGAVAYGTLLGVYKLSTFLGEWSVGYGPTDEEMIQSKADLNAWKLIRSVKNSLLTEKN